MDLFVFNKYHILTCKILQTLKAMGDLLLKTSANIELVLLQIQKYGNYEAKGIFGFTLLIHIFSRSKSQEATQILMFRVVAKTKFQRK